MKQFFGIGSGNSNYDGRRHIGVVLNYYSIFKMFSDKNTDNIISKALQFENYIFSAQYLCSCFYSAEFLSFVSILQSKLGLSNDEMSVLKSHLLFTTAELKTPAGYSRFDDITLIAHCAYVHRFFVPNNGNAVQQTVSFSKQCFTSMCISESDINKIYSIVNRELQMGNSNVTTIENKVHSMVI